MLQYFTHDVCVYYMYLCRNSTKREVNILRELLRMIEYHILRASSVVK